jgi:hypothetical protein
MWIADLFLVLAHAASADILALAAAWAAFDAMVFEGSGYQRIEDPSAKGVLCWGAGDPGHPVGGTGPGEKGNRGRR